MCERHKNAVAMAERVVTNLNAEVRRHDHKPFGPGSETLQQKLADQYARDAELLDTWTYIRDLLRNGKAMP